MLPLANPKLKVLNFRIVFLTPQQAVEEVFFESLSKRNNRRYPTRQGVGG